MVDVAPRAVVKEVLLLNNHALAASAVGAAAVGDVAIIVVASISARGDVAMCAAVL